MAAERDGFISDRAKSLNTSEMIFNFKHTGGCGRGNGGRKRKTKGAPSRDSDKGSVRAKSCDESQYQIEIISTHRRRGKGRRTAKRRLFEPLELI
jgi:hypothetical protein